MQRKAKPAPIARQRASGSVVAGASDSTQNIGNHRRAQGRKLKSFEDLRTALTEREITDGRRYLGTVRECPDGRFVAVVGEHVVGSYSTIAEATDAVIELGRGAP